MSELPVYETWLERSGHIDTVVTDAPGSMRLVDADDYDKLQNERDRLRDALEKALPIVIDTLRHLRATNNKAALKVTNDLADIRAVLQEAEHGE